jgi:molybdopterin/thiamine biosynthesis adenylyltransferase
MFTKKYRDKIGADSIRNVYKPVFFRISNKSEHDALESLIDSKSYIGIFDTIEAQLKELIRTKKPSVTLTDEEVKAGVADHLAGRSMDEYGVWVYYPWAERLVHLLDEEEFVRLRTNRNKYKITDAEQTTLFTKRVGVIGLSVGQSVSLTMAIERTFGELRIADFDELEITNLNRLRSGVHNMGLKKTVLVAREIAEIDPFLKVTCFHEGITDANMEQFLMENGKLDVLIDECDSVDVKIKCRVAARKHRIPVLMEASDRATIDIERFDLHPERPILHGFIEHLDISQMKNLKTMEEKLPYILPIVGIETMSPRLKASAVEIGQTISTWPQLASAVTLGGGITADICRKVLLDQLHVSGRYFIDMDELISDPQPQDDEQIIQPKALTCDVMKEYAARVPAAPVANVVSDKAIIEQLMDAAVLAPSAGNNQPWKWYFDGSRLFLFDDPSRSEAFANFDGMVSNLAMGTALENISLKAKALNVSLDTKLFPLGAGDGFNPIAVVTVSKGEAIAKDELINYIASRHTNRKPGIGGTISENVLQELVEAVSVVDGMSLHILIDPDDIAKIADITGEAEKLRMFIPRGHRDLFYSEIRWDKESAERTKDGLDVRTLDLEPKDAIGFKVIKDERAIELVNEWDMGAALENMTRKLVATSSAVCLVKGPGFTPEYCVQAGRATQRAWLVAEKNKLAVQPVMSAIFHFARLVHGRGESMPEKIQKKFNELHSEFIKLFGVSSTPEEPLFLFRLCFAEEPKVRSLRLNIDEVYCSSR